MTPLESPDFRNTQALDQRAVEHHFSASLRKLQSETDRFFAKLLVAEWIAAIGLALVVTPLTWEGRLSSLHPHVWVAVLFGGLVVVYPAWLGMKRSGDVATRHILAVSQMLMSALFIHLTGGRIETHFHVFGSLAFLSFYRDIRVLVTATVVVYVDHLLRGYFWPESVYGVFLSTPWRSVEHAFWVLFEVAFLALSIRRSLAEMHQVALRQISLEDINDAMEAAVRERTVELTRSEARYRSLFQEAPVGLYQAGADGTLTMANPTLRRMLGFPSEEALCAPEARLWSPDSQDQRQALFAELREKREVHGRDMMWLHREGAAVYVRESVRAHANEQGVIVRLEGSVEDVTERRQLEERYLQSQKVQAIGQLAGGVAHDFNNLLTAVMGYGEMLARGNLDTRSRGYLAEIKRASERATSLTQQLLAFSRKQTLQPRVLQLNDVIFEMDNMLRRLVGEHIRIRSVAAGDLALVKADPGQIQQVLLNLVVNARDAMPGGGHLTIETANADLDADYARRYSDVTPGNYVMFAVSDTGTGIPPEVMAHIFEPFFTTKEVGDGTGLGLATCHGIVKQSGGHIAVYSEVGHGTTIKVYLPQTKESADNARKETAPTELQQGDETVLFVEDEPVVREFGQQALTSLGYRVIEASNGVEALKRLEELDGQPLHLLITDVVMPEIGGPELARRLREISPSTPVLFNSGYTYDAMEHTDLLEEGIYFLQKPYTMTGLGKKVREVLEHSSAVDLK